MSTSTSPASTPALDLFDRWLAHHRDEAAATGDGPSTTAEEVSVGAQPTVITPTPDARELVVPHAPSADDAGRAVLAALAEPAVDSPTAPRPESLGVAADATTPEVPTPEVRAVSLRAPTPVLAVQSASAAAGALTPPRSAAPVRPARPPAAVKASPVKRPVPTPGPGLVIFTPRRGARRVITALLVVATAATAAAGLAAWEARTTTSYAVACALGAVAALLLSARGRATGTEVSVENGMLRIAQGPTLHRFPLAGSYPPIDVLGEPGDRGWKVLIQRRGMAPYAVTASMVDPADFTEMIRRFRPDA